MAEKVKCLNCMEEFEQTDNPPGPHDEPAGRMDDGRMMYNTKCPGCGVYDRMNSDYVGIPEDILKAYRDNRHEDPENAVNLQMLLDYKNGDVTEEKLREELGLK